MEKRRDMVLLNGKYFDTIRLDKLIISFTTMPCCLKNGDRLNPGYMASKENIWLVSSISC